MSEMSSGMRALEMSERQTFHRARAQRELSALLEGRPRRRFLRTRGARPAA